MHPAHSYARAHAHTHTHTHTYTHTHTHTRTHTHARQALESVWSVRADPRFVPDRIRRYPGEADRDSPWPDDPD